MSGFWVKVAKTLHFHGRRSLRLARGVWWDIARPEVREPVFIVGCSRAGTTLVYKTFSESRQLGSLHRETHDFWASLHPPQERQWDTHAIDADRASPQERDRVARYFYQFTGSRRFVDKNNQNGLSIPYLHRLFPDAYFVYVKRSPGDNLNSLIEGWRRDDEFATWSNDLPEKIAVDNGAFSRWCFFLADGWREYAEASLQEVCAFQYRAMNEAILEGKKGIPENRWVEIVYEDLLTDPVGGFAKAFQAVGLEFDEAMQNHCKTVLATPYNAFSEIRADKWRSQEHSQRIEQVLPGLGDLTARMGY